MKSVDNPNCIKFFEMFDSRAKARLCSVIARKGDAAEVLVVQISTYCHRCTLSWSS